MTEPDALLSDRGLGSIDHSQAPRAVYYTTSTGERWRVLDCVVRDGKPVRIRLPDSNGPSDRVFVAANGVKRYYRRLKGEVWRATPAQLDRKLAASEFQGLGPSLDLRERTAR